VSWPATAGRWKPASLVQCYRGAASSCAVKSAHNLPRFGAMSALRFLTLIIGRKSESGRCCTVKTAVEAACRTAAHVAMETKVRMQIATYREHELSSKLFRDQAADLLLLRAAPAALRQPDPQYIHWRRYETRQIEPLPSSLTMSEPSCATATPTGRPQTSLSLIIKPVKKSSYSPVGWSFLRKIWTTL